MPPDVLLQRLVERVGQSLGPGLTTIAIDGVDGVGKTTFANALAERLTAAGLTVARSSIDGFHHPRATRYRLGKDSPAGFFRDSHDLAALRTELLYPARIGLPCLLAVFDHRRNRLIARKPQTIGLPAVLVFDGLFLHRPELRDEWDLSVLLDAPFEVTFARMAARDGSDPDPAARSNRRYREGQLLYFAEARPQQQADILVDCTDWSDPQVIRDASGSARSPDGS